MRRGKLHNSWRAMRARCQQENNQDYARYGAIGIKVQGDWNDFLVFKKWAISNGYKEGLTIDRIDNKKGYSADNCRWASRLTQSNNRKDSLLYKFTAETLSDAIEFYDSMKVSHADMVSMMGVSKTVFTRLVSGYYSHSQSGYCKKDNE